MNNFNNMSYPLIILGAGASHDYLLEADGLPMTNQLVDPKFLDLEISNKYKEVENLLSNLSSAIKLNNKGFEEQLNIIKNESGDKTHRKLELNSLKFYLRDLFSKFSEKFYSINNYKSLIGYIRDWSNGEASIINFNYDTFFEKSYNKEINSIRDYANGSLKIFKVHGSCDWTYIYRRNDYRIQGDEIKNEYDLIKIIGYQGETIYHANEINNRDFFKIPALAIPLPEKQNFVCPPEHISILEKQLNLVDRILIIGWSANDPLFIDILEKNLKNLTKVTIIVGSTDSATEVKKKLQHIKNLKFEITHYGFSTFVADSNFCKNFFIN